MTHPKISALNRLGQSFWLDNINRKLLASGELRRMIADGLSGMTSNPSIFEKAVAGSSDYDEWIARLAGEGKSTLEIYDEITVAEVREAADLFLSVFEETDGRDGYVSLEVNPRLAEDADATVQEARRLHKTVDRPNILFKVPATPAGFPAIRQLLSIGINVNATLIFSLAQYRNTARAYIEGVTDWIRKGGDPRKVSGVASVFVSRVDTLTDKIITEKLDQETQIAKSAKLKSLVGKTAAANARLIWSEAQKIFGGKDFAELSHQGAWRPRIVWGSTSTKNHAYSDVKYVEEIIGLDTVNTLPDETYYAFLDHGMVKDTLSPNLAEAGRVITDLKSAGIDIDKVCEKLLKDGVEAFVKSYDNLLAAIKTKAAVLARP